MLQLIYTSAPRLLEAGKTGFGTIARSRQIPTPLVTHLERLSTFDREAQVNALEFYSVFRMGRMAWHIFSKVRDCGVDYTQRTNHLAHHFIVMEDSDEMQQLLSTTPAKVMQALSSSWCSSWQTSPAWLPDNTQPLVIHDTGVSNIWQHFTGNDNNKHWLADHQFADGGTLLLPDICSETQALALLHEALLQRNDNGWGLGFTTAAVSTLSAKICPLVCIRHAQQVAGIQPRSGYICISLDSQLQPPVIPMEPMVTEWEIPSAPVAEAPEISPSTPRFRAPESTSQIPVDFTPVTPRRKTPSKKNRNKEDNSQYGLIIGILSAIVVILLYIMISDSPEPVTNKRPSPKQVQKSPQADEAGKAAPKEPKNPLTEAPLSKTHPSELVVTFPEPQRGEIVSQHPAQTEQKNEKPEETTINETHSSATTEPDVSSQSTVTSEEESTEPIQPTQIEIKPRETFKVIIDVVKSTVTVSINISKSEIADALNSTSNFYVGDNEVKGTEPYTHTEQSLKYNIPRELQDAYDNKCKAEEEKKKAEAEWVKEKKYKPEVAEPKKKGSKKKCYTRETLDNAIKGAEKDKKLHKELEEMKKKAEPWFVLSEKEKQLKEAEKELEAAKKDAEQQLAKQCKLYVELGEKLGITQQIKFTIHIETGN